MIHQAAIVSLPVSSRFGVVTKLETVGQRHLATVAYIDPATGNVMECPDDRCKGKSESCPIHQSTTDVHRLVAWDKKSIQFYEVEGMLSKTLADAALAVGGV